MKSSVLFDAETSCGYTSTNLLWYGSYLILISIIFCSVWSEKVWRERCCRSFCVRLCYPFLQLLKFETPKVSNNSQLDPVTCGAENSINGKLCTWLDKLEFLFSLFPFIKNHNLLFALACPPVCKPEASGQGIAIRTKVEQTRSDFSIWVK